jgi:hypothetical protein
MKMTLMIDIEWRHIGLIEKKKKKPSIEALTFEGTIHMLKYLNMFTQFKIYSQRIGQRGGDIKQLVPKYLVI